MTAELYKETYLEHAKTGNAVGNRWANSAKSFVKKTATNVGNRASDLYNTNRPGVKDPNNEYYNLSPAEINSQLSEFRNRKTNAQVQIERDKSEVSRLNKEITQLQSEIPYYDSEISKLQKAAATSNSKLNIQKQKDADYERELQKLKQKYGKA